MWRSQKPRARFSTTCARRLTGPWRRNTAMKRFARYLVFYSALIGIWFLLAKLKVWPPCVFPTPQGVLESLWAGFSDHSLWLAIGVSMKRMLLGYRLSVRFGKCIELGDAG